MRTLRPSLLVIVLVTLIAAPAAQARHATRHVVRGTVITLDRAHHRAQLLRRSGDVRNVRYRHTTGDVAPGTQVTATTPATGGAATLTPTGTTPTATLPATVTPTGLTSANGVSLNVSIAGLAPGTKVSLTLTFSGATVQLSLEVQGGRGDEGDDDWGDDDEGDDPGDDDSDECSASAAFGTVEALNRLAGRITLDLPGGGRAVFPAPPASVSGVSAGDQVVVTTCDGDVTAVTKQSAAQTVVAGTVVRVDDDAQQLVLRKADRSIVAIDLPDGFDAGVDRSDAVLVLVHADRSGDLVADAIDAQESDD